MSGSHSCWNYFDSETGYGCNLVVNDVGDVRRCCDTPFLWGSSQRLILSVSGLPASSCESLSFSAKVLEFSFCCTGAGSKLGFVVAEIAAVKLEHVA